MSDLRTIKTLGLKNKKTLREYFQVKNIRSMYAVFGVSSQNEAYEAMQDIYNQYVEQQREIKKQEKKRIDQLKSKMNVILEEMKETKNKKIILQARDNLKLALQELEVKKSLTYSVKIDKDTFETGFDGKSRNIQANEYYQDLKRQIIAILMKNRGKTILAISSKSGELFGQKNIEIPTDYNLLQMQNLFDSEIAPVLVYQYLDGEQIHIFQGDYGKVSLFVGIKTIPRKLIQNYLDGENQKHCVIDPLLDMFTRYAENSESKDSKRKLNKIVSKLTEFRKIYKKGVPEDEMEKIAKTISRRIEIHDLFGGVIKVYNEKSTAKIHFTNTRKHHLDIGYITLNQKPIKVKKNEIKQIIKEHKQNKEFYIFDGDIDDDSIHSLSSARGNWIVVNDEYEIYNEFDNSIGKRGYGIDSIQYPELNKFLKEGQIVNASPVGFTEDPNNLEGVKHIDVTKAYTQFKHCKNYMGFLGNIHQYAKFDLLCDGKMNEFFNDFVTNNLSGIFQVEILECKDVLLNKLGINENFVYTLPLPEIKTFVEDYGVKLRVIAGAVGNCFKFEFPDYMLENRRYCIWSGKLGQDSEFKNYKFKGDPEWAAHLSYEFCGTDKKVIYFPKNNVISVKLPKSQNYTYHHIFAFITSYTRLNVLNEMRKVDGELVKVILDGIYYRGSDFKTDVPCKESFKLKEHIGFTDGWYNRSQIHTDHWETYDTIFKNNVVLTGFGGSGKSHHVFNSNSLLKPLYITPCHLLGRHFSKKYNCNYITINKLVGLDCCSFKDEKGYDPSIVFIDEITMIDRKHILKACLMYPNTKIILAGDVDEFKWYQCRNGKDNNYNEIITREYLKENNLSFDYVKFEIDRRAKDEELKEMKLYVRDCMDKVFTDGCVKDAYKVANMVRKKYGTIEFEDAVKQFKDGDVFIAGTHKTNDTLLKNNIVSGYMTKDKELIFDTKNMPDKCIKRGSFTTHSFQGFTIEDKKVFVVLDLFEYAMLYTSISRCVNFNQIVLVEKPIYELNAEIVCD